MAQERPPHPFVVPETRALGDLHDPADLPAFSNSRAVSTRRASTPLAGVMPVRLA